MGGKCTKNIFDGTNERNVLVFPTSISTAGSIGHFSLVEDDGKTNAAAFTQIELSFAVVDVQGEEVVQVDYTMSSFDHKLPYDTLWWELPSGDARRIIGAEGKEVRKDTKGRFGLKV